MMSIPIILAEPLELESSGFLMGHKDITLFESRERFLAAVAKAIKPPQVLSDPRTLDLSGSVKFSRKRASSQPCRIHAASSHEGQLFSITIRKPPKKQGT